MKNVKEKESKSQRNIFSIAYPEYQSLNNLHELPQVLYSNKQFNCTDGEKEIKTQNNQYSQDTSYNNGSTLIDKSYGKLNQQYDFQSKSLNPYSLDLTHVQEYLTKNSFNDLLTNQLKEKEITKQQLMKYHLQK